MTQVFKVSQRTIRAASPKQLNFISKLIFEKAAYEQKILTYFNIISLENLSSTQASELIDMLMKMESQEHITNELCIHNHNRVPKES